MLARLGAEGRWVLIENQTSPTAMGPVVQEISNDDDWRGSIRSYIEEGKLPVDEIEKRKPIQRAAWYTMTRESMYRRSTTGLPLRR